MTRPLTTILLTVVCSAGAFVSGLEARAETAVPRVGVLMTHGDDVAKWFPSFLRVLKENDWVDGQNVTFEYRAGHNDLAQTRKGASALVQGKVDLILAIGPPAVRAAYDATHTIPIVAHDYETDPISAGYAESYSRPGRNLTGMFLDSPELATKWLQLLRDLLPDISRVAVLVDPAVPPTHLQSIERIAPSVHIELQVIEIRSADQIARAASQLHGHPEALVILPSPVMFLQSPELAKLARKLNVPAISMFGYFP